MNRLVIVAVSIEMSINFTKTLRLYIMEGVMIKLKLELDKTFKCLLLKDSKIKDKVIVNDRVNFEMMLWN